MKRFFLTLCVLPILVCVILATGCDNRDALPSESEIETEAPPTEFCSDKLEKYAIIYNKSNPNYYGLALKLKKQISVKYGKKLTVVCDTDAEPSEYEIILGETDRYDIQGRVMEYSVTVDSGRFLINVGGPLSAEKAIDFLCDDVFSGQELKLAPGEYYQCSLLPEPCSVTENTTARIMTANLLADQFSDASHKSAYYRGEIFAAMLVTYTPDVVGLQETDEGWSQALDVYLAKIKKSHGITYSRYLDTFEGKTNYTSLLYRSDKLKVEDGSVKVFSWWTDGAFDHDYHMRNVSWARFSSLDDPDKQFIVANTHWSYRTEHANGSTCLSGATTPIANNELRVQCKNETNELLSALKKSNSDMPIFLTGDLNTSLPFFTQYGWTPDSFRIISEEAKECDAALSTVPESGHFDHIFGTGSYSINRYEFFGDTDLHALLTDHPFVYTDLIF